MRAREVEDDGFAFMRDYDDEAAPAAAAAPADGWEEERRWMWGELQRLRSLLDDEQKQRRASTFMERMQLAQLRQQTESLRRAIEHSGSRSGSAGASAAGADLDGGALAGAGLRSGQQALYDGMAELQQRLQRERMRHAGFATELRSFARHMNLDPQDLDVRPAPADENVRPRGTARRAGSQGLVDPFQGNKRTACASLLNSCFCWREYTSAGFSMIFPTCLWNCA